jgi:hypothetical protein
MQKFVAIVVLAAWVFTAAGSGQAAVTAVPSPAAVAEIRSTLQVLQPAQQRCHWRQCAKSQYYNPWRCRCESRR